MDLQLMKFDLFYYALSFLEGLALIISPCILPILPIMLAGAIEGDRARSVGIVCGFTFSFALFTLFSRALVQHLGIDLNLLRQGAFVLIALFGLVLLSDTLSDKFNLMTQQISNLGQRYSNNKHSFTGGLLLGCFVSLIWVPCGGPILAASIVQTAIQKTTLQGFLTFFFFALGSVIPMLVIAFLGKRLILSLRFLSSHSKTIRKVMGLIIILAAFFAFVVEKYSNTVIMPNAPNVVQKQSQTPIQTPKGSAIKDELKQSYPAPDFQGITDWINSSPLHMADLKGKVVLIDFWTYSCINCVRTLPYLKNWYDKYHDQGLVIIGVHTPEFQFEKDLDNVKRAVEAYQIHYPVALDNDYGTWTNYQNLYWPAHYLIDKNGNIVYEHFGEGHYDETEYNIVTLLGMKTIPQTTLVTNENSALMFEETPETYLGFWRQEGFKDEELLVKNQIKQYNYPQNLPKDAWALQGKWLIAGDKIIAKAQNVAIKIHFFAKKAYVVMGSPDDKPVLLQVLLNGKPIGQNAGKDVHNNTVAVKAHTLYELVDFKEPQGGILELNVSEPGVEMYTFTFG